MKGVWVERAVKPHVCPLPASWPWRRIYAGSVWRCGCGQEWVATGRSRGDGHRPFWAKVEEDLSAVSTTWSPGVPLPRLYPLTDTNTI